ncbi:MAG: pentapeptide repeat-containing protein [Chloroflexi bacterium]|nr:pentapeptide repeat-containing protein [Chloroflexota bacterium]
MIGVAAVGLWSLVNFWDWLQIEQVGDEVSRESGSTTVRNIGLIVAGVVALPLALWRSWVAQRQANTSQQNLLNERYQQGAEMLGSNVLPVRLGGIYNLERLAADYPGQYHIQIMKLFCTFARVPIVYEGVESKNLRDSPDADAKGRSSNVPPPIREDVQAIMTAIGTRSAVGIALEKKMNVTLDLHGADLSHAQLSGANLAGVNMSRTNLSHASFFERFEPIIDPFEPIPSGPDQPKARPVLAGETIRPDLAGMEDRRANLSGAILSGADLSDSWLLGTDLSGALLLGAKLRKANVIYAKLRNAALIDAKLQRAFIVGSDLSGARLGGANLTKANLSSTKLYGTDFFSATLKKTDFSGALVSKNDGEVRAIGLVQQQLDQVKIDSHSPPSLAGVTDMSTGKQLVWPGKASDDTPT